MTLKNLPKYLPILSIVLVFIGYCNLHFYYCSQFNIDIYQFISTGEILLSFLPIAYYLFILMVCFMFIGILIGMSPEEAKQKEKKKPRVFSIPFSKYKISTGKDYSFSVFYRFYKKKFNVLNSKQKWHLRYKMIFHFQTIIFIIWGLINIYIYKNNGAEDVPTVILFGVIWISFLFTVLQRRINRAVSNLFKQNYKQVYLGSLLFIMFIFLDFEINKSKAIEVKEGIDKNAVFFNYNGTRINTFKDTSLAYIGSTQQYLFMYDLKTKNTLIFEKNKTSNFRIGTKPVPPKFIIDKKSFKKGIKNICDSLKYYDKTAVKDSALFHHLLQLCDSIKTKDIFHETKP